MFRRLSLIIGAFSLLTVTITARAAGLGAAQDFNVLTFGNFASTSDVEGKLAVGGDMTVSGFSVASSLDASANGTDTLVVGGTLNFGNGSVNYGNVAWGVAYNGPGYNIATNGTVRQDPNAFDFAAAQTDLMMLSTQLGALADTGNTFFNGYGQVTLTGVDPSLNVFSMTTVELSGLNGFEINVPTNSTTIINVFGNAATIGGFGYWGTGVNRHYTLFNFVNATSFFAQHNGIEGSVLAPFADAVMSGGSVNGQFVAKSANMLNGAEGHYYTFRGSLPPRSGGAIPEPGSVALLATGVLPAVGLLRRRGAA